MALDDLLAKTAYLREEEREVLSRAYALAERAHEGQSRLSGEPYVSHPVAVAAILADLGLDADTLVAALLHDTVEDTDVTREQLRDEFGAHVAKLVDGVTKLGKIHVHTREQAQAENIRKMLVAMAEDIRVVLIKLGDRLHNMRTVGAHTEERRQRISRETLDIYAPLAHRLGIWQIKGELEDLAFAQLDPDNYHAVAAKVSKAAEERGTFIRNVTEILEREFERLGIAAEITGRPKHIYSIHDKMERTHKDFDEIYDLIALRILVDSIKDCYGALGTVHSLWKPIPGRFKDYVAMPKGNGYQSLHTTVVSHTGEPMEVQIRTQEMHSTAEYGIAAHWHYKEGAQQTRFDERYGWLRLLMDWQKEVLDAEAFVDTVKVDIFQDEVFVFTPKGDVRSLPMGSTPVDFAYRVHTDVGHHCIGAKVNSRMVSLDYHLEHGDIVEVLTTKGAHAPSRDWLTFVKTSSAREKIRSWFKKERREENIQKGREQLDKEFRRLRQQALSSLREERLLELAEDFKYATTDDFLAALGYGDVSARGAVLRYSDRESPDQASETMVLGIPLISATPVTNGHVRVHGMTDMLTTLAQCCKPLAGDSIRGYITRGKGVTVHRDDCVNVRNAADPDRIVEVEWERGSSQVYPVNIKIEAWDRTGLLRDIAAVIAESKINLSGADVQVYDDRTAVISTIVEIANLTQLSRLLERLEGVRDVHTVAREAV
ncbi:MAG TPA: bifunctional (p)ppGpp synthetase/guanosine-3',5'-bis(diphosphate) 3'-pyrophosphohydrolase [Candidatus Dormibacteraeota bacterium]|jgi:GTP pyrophosphokinase|nr:bifunctional (p)ppGpp synthetase/guanosine-3',5'-bis(diphosphate) 3'-pyrophosphohydrolase [Candidatus Dormibacteraeota bacterium]